MPTFTRQERLKSRKAIGSLFKGGHSFVAYPLRVVWKEAPVPASQPESEEKFLPTEVVEGEKHDDVRAQIVISVPKRNFKTAVARNRLRRQIREAYRLQKHEFYHKLAASDLRISIMVSYIAKEALPFADISAGVGKLIRKFPGIKARPV
ncbi:MAG: ribonuclease P protein component [Saprospiraceae bacterium]